MTNDKHNILHTVQLCIILYIELDAPLYWIIVILKKNTYNTSYLCIQSLVCLIRSVPSTCDTYNNCTN